MDNKTKIGDLIEQLQEVAQCKATRDLKGSWYKGSRTYLDALVSEVKEVEEELDPWRQCFLEDEVGDLLWNLVCLIEHLELEGKVNKSDIFRRSLKKYTERVTSRAFNESWDDVKKRQKLELQREYEQQSNS